MHKVPRLKFCGFTQLMDVDAAIEAGADAIGLNFYEKSRRYVDPVAASRLSEAMAGRVLRVGVFVDATPLEVAAVVAQCALDAIQLHGEESVAWVEESQTLPELRGLGIIKALPYRGPEDDPVVAAWSSYGAYGDTQLIGLLVDAYDPVLRGGTGRTARWELLNPRPSSFGSGDSGVDSRSPTPLILAGGIHRANAAAALEAARPEGIDLASGIEVSPGIKDPDAMREIGRIVREYYAQR
ncbi:MAG: phosphoribosylanthranilate isomerase [Pirellula sp.]